MPDKKPEKKLEPHKPCKAGEHTFIVTYWENSARYKKAVHMRCRHCLMPVDLVEIENAKWFKE